MPETPPNYVELSADIVSAYVSKNAVTRDDLPALIASVHTALSNAANGKQQAEKPLLEPPVSIKKSISANHLISMGGETVCPVAEAPPYGAGAHPGAVSGEVVAAVRLTRMVCCRTLERRARSWRRPSDLGSEGSRGRRGAKEGRSIRRSLPYLGGASTRKGVGTAPFPHGESQSAVTTFAPSLRKSCHLHCCARRRRNLEERCIDGIHFGKFGCRRSMKTVVETM